MDVLNRYKDLAIFIKKCKKQKESGKKIDMKMYYDAKLELKKIEDSLDSDSEDEDE